MTEKKMTELDGLRWPKYIANAYNSTVNINFGQTKYLRFTVSLMFTVLLISVKLLRFSFILQSQIRLTELASSWGKMAIID